MSKPYSSVAQVQPGNTFMRPVNDSCFFQSELSVGSSKDREVRAKETAVRGLVSTNSSITNLSSSSISNNWCGMSEREERYCGSPSRVPLL